MTEKNTRDYLSDVVKYAGPSAGVGFAVAEVMCHLIPGILDIKSAIAIVAMFLANIVMVLLKTKDIIYKE